MDTRYLNAPIPPYKGPMQKVALGLLTKTQTYVLFAMAGVAMVLTIVGMYAITAGFPVWIVVVVVFLYVICAIVLFLTRYWPAITDNDGNVIYYKDRHYQLTKNFNVGNESGTYRNVIVGEEIVHDKVYQDQQ